MSETEKRSGRTPHRGRARTSPTDGDVLAVVTELCESYRSPSTALIIWHLTDQQPSASAAFRTAVRQALERLHAHGQLHRATHRGTHRWQAAQSAIDPGAEERP